MKSEALKLLYPNIPTSVFDITTKKGKIPYDYLKPERLKENCLPDLEYWHDELYDEDISLQDLKDYQEIFTLTREQGNQRRECGVSCFSSIRNNRKRNQQTKLLVRIKIQNLSSQFSFGPTLENNVFL